MTCDNNSSRRSFFESYPPLCSGTHEAYVGYPDDADPEERSRARAFEQIVQRKRLVSAAFSEVHATSGKRNKFSNQAAKSPVGKNGQVLLPTICASQSLDSTGSQFPSQCSMAISSLKQDANILPKWRIRGKSGPSAWWLREGIHRLKQSGYTWVDTRQAIDFYLAWAHSRVYGETDLEMMPFNMSRRTLLQKWQELEEGERAQWILSARQGRSLFPKADRPSSEYPLPAGVTQDMMDGEFRPPGILFTWHGDWGELDAEVQEIMAAHEDCDEERYEALRQCKYFQRLGQEFFEFCVKASRLCGYAMCSTAVESCTQESSFGRVHLHCYVSGGRSRIRAAEWFLVWEFQNVRVAHVSFTGYAQNSTAGREGRSSAAFHSKRGNEAHYYLQFPKIGGLHQDTNYKKYECFHVLSRWCMNQYKQRKMTVDTCISEVLASRDRVKGSLTELEFQRNRLLDLEVMEKVRSAQLRVCKTLRPFIDEPPEVVEFKAQFNTSLDEPLQRFKPLILDGGTRFGKSNWAKSFFGADRTLTLNCQDSKDPNMTQWKVQSKHFKAILFDEGSWQLVHSNKLLFQAGVDPVGLGESPTMQYAYNVFVYGVPMIVCSNNFYRDIGEEEYNYMLENVIYLKVDKPCFTLPKI